ncbi:MAG: hypothetical protein CSA62_07945 [Planctomycetota bacterium]|nr:MAG: hypothetical protein CSA62_07945 [Planctomycetota bacterium]
MLPPHTERGRVMTDSNDAADKQDPAIDQGQAPELGHWQRVLSWFGALPTWSKGLFGLAASFLLLGLIAFALEDAPPASAQPIDHAQSPRTPGQELPHTLRTKLQDTGKNSFLPSPGGKPQLPIPQTPKKQDSSSQDSAQAPWSASFFRLGFSFFAGFSIGLALRSILHLLTIGIGIAFLFLMVLGYFEFISVNWAAFDQLFSSIGERIAGESERFRSFITGSLPSAGLAATGLTIGLRKRR